MPGELVILIFVIGLMIWVLSRDQKNDRPSRPTYTTYKEPGNKKVTYYRQFQWHVPKNTSTDVSAPKSNKDS